MPIADFHAHSTLKYYANTHPNDNRVKLWNKLITNCTSGIFKILKCLRFKPVTEVTSSTQSDFLNLAMGNSILNYMVLGQLEAGFTRIKIGKKTIDDANEELKINGKTPRKGIGKKMEFIECLAGVSHEKLMFINQQIESKNNTDTYFSEFKKEIDYVLLHVNKSFLTPKGENVTVRLPKDKAELIGFLSNEINILVMIFAIEGIQAISKIGKIDNSDLQQHLLHYKEAITFLKTPYNFEGNDYAITPFYLSPAHHFPNYLFGHSKTFSGVIGKMLNQELNPSFGISAEGITIIDLLLSTTNGKRILIDVKHFSVQARRDYYMYLNRIDPDKLIPIVCSHTGITNTSWRRPNNGIPENNESKKGNNYFLDWNINLYYEELLMIYERNGLIGMQLDEKRIGDGHYGKKIKSDEERIAESEKLLLANMLVIVRTIKDIRAWDIICIGSDFDGLVNSLDNAANTKQLPELKKRLISLIDDPQLSWNLKGLGVNQDLDFIITQQEINELKFGLTGAEIMEKIFWSNLKDFTIKHF